MSEITLMLDAVARGQKHASEDLLPLVNEELRRMGAHRNRLPWVSMNHLNGIMGLEDFDPTLYQQLAIDWPGEIEKQKGNK